MGVLQRFERRLEGLVSGAFAKAFKADVQPVEIASALQRELDDRAAIVSRGATIVPNKFVVELSSHDYERLSVYARTLSDELAEVVREHAGEQNYQLRGDVDISFSEDASLEIGRHRITSSVVASVREVAKVQAPPPGVSKAPERARDKTEVLAAARAAVPWLEVNGEKYPLTRPVTVLGRGTQVDLRVDDAGVSRRHAEIQLGDAPYLVDLGSTNGTLLDGAKVERSTLTDGAKIGLGDTVLIFRTPRPGA